MPLIKESGFTRFPRVSYQFVAQISTYFAIKLAKQLNVSFMYVFAIIESISNNI